MTPSEIRDATLSQLRAAKTQMMSNRWLAAVKTKTPDERTLAAETLFKIQDAILELTNAELAGIRDDLLANEAELTTGRQALATALGDLKKVKTVLNAASGLLAVVGRIISLV